MESGRTQCFMDSKLLMERYTTGRTVRVGSVDPGVWNWLQLDGVGQLALTALWKNSALCPRLELSGLSRKVLLDLKLYQL